MQQITNSSRVFLVHDHADLHLHQGEIGVVCSSWHSPTVAYEVEFQPDGKPIRLLLLSNQIHFVSKE